MSKFKIKNVKFELWTSFGIDSPSVHHFVRTLTFGIGEAGNLRFTAYAVRYSFQISSILSISSLNSYRSVISLRY